MLATASASFLGFVAVTLSSGEPQTPPPAVRRHDLLDERMPVPATPWPSMLTENVAVAGVPPAWNFAPTPTPTATPEPTATPLPPTPVPPPAPTEESYTPPVPSGDWRDIVCSYGWSCAEALNVIARESGGNPYAVNSSSGACGLFQMLPCVGYGDPATNIAAAWAKYVDGGYSFYRHWYQWWR